MILTKQKKNEQFLGGAYATGYIGLDNCNVKVNGFVSDYGYVHNGGLVGMFALYPAGTQYTSYITNNHIEGIISFLKIMKTEELTAQNMLAKS